MLIKWDNWEEMTLSKRFDKVKEWEIRPLGIFILLGHVLGFQGFFALFTGQICLKHFLLLHCWNVIGGFAVVSGSHRLWTHRSYKATLPLRILLAIGHSMSGFYSVIDWCRMHRLHHKYSETDADPHNSTRGFFFSHMGWVLLKEHPEVGEKEKTMDFSDLHRDPVLAFQHKYNYPIEILLCYLLPVVIPSYLWDIPLYTCVVFNAARLMISFQFGMLGNSVAHSWIQKPFDKRISPSDSSWLSLFTFGEGWHNFHHIFPWDYRNTDIGLHLFNGPRIFIELMAKIGWAYDLKTVPDHVIRKRAARTGDGSHQATADSGDILVNLRGCKEQNSEEASPGRLCKTPRGIHNLAGMEIGPGAWGWGDSDIPRDDVEGTIISNSKKGHEDGE